MLAHPHLFFLAATLGLGVQLLTSAVIQAVGSVTLKVLSQVRNAGLVVAGVVFYDETVTTTQMGGYLVSLAAFGAYNYFKLQGSPKAPSAHKPARSPHPLSRGGEEASEDRESNGSMGMGATDSDEGNSTARDRLLSSSEKGGGGGGGGGGGARMSRIRKS